MAHWHGANRVRTDIRAGSMVNVAPEAALRSSRQAGASHGTPGHGNGRSNGRIAVPRFPP